jgi:hypothetical protein
MTKDEPPSIKLNNGSEFLEPQGDNDDKVKEEGRFGWRDADPISLGPDQRWGIAAVTTCCRCPRRSEVLRLFIHYKACANLRTDSPK